MVKGVPNGPRLAKAGHGMGVCIVVSCPHDIFPKGNRIPWSQFGGSTQQSTLEDGYFPLGMVVSYKEKLYVVCGDGRFWLEQKKLGYPQVPYPAQWLREI